MSATPNRLALRPDIEGLRAIAIIGGVLFHAHVPGFAAGFVGMEIFFPLSGYLITGLLLGEFARKGTLDLVAFYARRTRRLLPAAFVMMLATAVLFRCFKPVGPQEWLANGAIATALFGSNYYFIRASADYFGHGETHPLLHTWSLAVEEQFYLLWPLLLLLLLRRPWSVRTRLVVLGVATVAGLALAQHGVLTHRSLAFYSGPHRFWEFGAGALVAWLEHAGYIRMRKSWSEWGALLGLGLIALSFVYLHGSSPFPGLLALPAVAGTLLTLVSTGTGAPRTNRVLGTRALQHVGALSYSLYLWHWPLLKFEFFGQDASLAERLLVVAASYLLAWLSYRFLEDRVRNLPSLVASHRRSLVLAAAVVIAGAGVGVWWRWSVVHRELPELLARAEQGEVDLPRGLASYSEASPVVVRDTPRGAVLERWALFGDSHAEHWRPALRSVLLGESIELVTIAKGGCPASPLDVTLLGRPYPECATWRARSLDLLRELRPKRIIVSQSEGHTEDAAALAASMRELQRLLPVGAADVVWLRGAPSAAFDGISGDWQTYCIEEALERSSDVEAECSFARPAEPTPFTAIVREPPAGAMFHMQDWFAIFCAADRCPAEFAGEALYRDNQHLTRLAAEKAASAVRSRLVSLGWLAPPSD